MSSNNSRSSLKSIMGPRGFPMTLTDLPSPKTKRWVTDRKAEVICAVRGGLLSLEEACRRYTLTIDEFLEWQRGYDADGLKGLRATKGEAWGAKEAQREVAGRATPLAATTPKTFGCKPADDLK